jgi:hypothetical protein
MLGDEGGVMREERWVDGELDAGDVESAIFS